MAKLSSEQQSALEQWAAAGATLNDIQQRLKSEFGISLTYLDARLLMTDLQVKIQDKRKDEPKVEASPLPPEPAAGIKMTVDKVPMAGMLISGAVTFSDGITCVWHLDQMGRPGLSGQAPNYQPPEQDIPVFQTELDRVLVEAGL